MKAYIVDCDGENGGQIYFAKTRGQAKATAANEEECRITEVVSCKRAPELDQYSPGPVPVGVLLSMGWWFECYGCSRRVTGDGEDYDYDTDEELVPVVERDKVWCSGGCKHRWLIREARRKIEEEQRKIKAIRLLEMSFPGAVYHSAQSCVPSGMRLDNYSPFVLFDIPGSTQHIGWETCSHFVSVAPIDRDAWYRYEDSRLADVYVWENEGGAVA